MDLPCKNTINPREAIMKMARRRDIRLSSTSGASEIGDCEDLIESESEDGRRKSGEVSEGVELDWAAVMVAAQSGDEKLRRRESKSAGNKHWGTTRERREDMADMIVAHSWRNGAGSDYQAPGGRGAQRDGRVTTAGLASRPGRVLCCSSIWHLDSCASPDQTAPSTPHARQTAVAKE